jgi:hypothetical protein
MDLSGDYSVHFELAHTKEGGGARTLIYGMGRTRHSRKNSNTPKAINSIMKLSVFLRTTLSIYSRLFP